MNQDQIDQLAKKFGKEIQRRLRDPKNRQSLKQLAWEVSFDRTITISIVDPAHGDRILEVILNP